MGNLSDLYTLPLDDWIEAFVRGWLVPNFRPTFRAIQWPVDQLLTGIEGILLATPFVLFLLLAGLVAWWVAGRSVALFTVVSFAFLDLLGIWPQTMTTLAMVITAVVCCAIIGIPLGIIAARSDRFAAGIRPVLDIMQTTPAFVYLVPVVMLFGVGMVPGIIATIIFALPPIIRLTNLGIRQVRGELVEAGFAFGATQRQVLWEIQMPLAMRTIMAGLNQTLMLSLSMVVIAALIGAEGLGLIVFRGIGRLDVGLAALGGIGIVLLAIVLDRITQALGEPEARLRSTARRHAVLARIWPARGTAAPAPPTEEPPGGAAAPTRQR